MRQSYSFRCNGEKGFTLLEVLLALAISAMVFQVAYTLLFTSYTSFKRISAMVDAQENVRLAMGHIMRSLRQVAHGSQVTVDTDNHALIVDNRRFYLNNGSLYEEIDGTTNELAYGITQFSVSRDGLKVVITITGQNSQGRGFSLSSSHVLRR